jgi:calcineurin-like phosphoesterase family protein
MKIKDIFSRDKIFFTSDTHFDHDNILRFSGRPFRSVDNMNEQLIKRWNEVVPHDSVVFHMGDFAFSNGMRVRDFCTRLNGKIYLCRGNHDRDKTVGAAFHISMVNDVYEITVAVSNDIYQKIFLSHYAHKVWKGSHKGTWHLYGHSHGSLHDDPYSRSMDVGVDTHDYRPYTFSEIEKAMSKKQFKPVDHHGIRESDLIKLKTNE